MFPLTSWFRATRVAPLLAMVWVGSPLRAQEGGAVATVDGNPISREQLVERLLADAGASLLDKLIQEKVVEQAAAKGGVTVAEEEIDQQLNDVKASLPRDKSLDEMLAEQGMSMVTLREQVRMRLRLRKLVGDFKLDENQLRNYYTGHRWMFDEKEQVHVCHLFHQNEQALKLLKLKLSRGLSFEELAKEVRGRAAAMLARGDPPDQGEADLGWITRELTNLEAPFVELAFSLKPGEVGGPVKTDTEYHLIKVIEHKPAFKPTFEQIQEKVRETVYAQELQSRMGERMAALMKEAKIEKRLELPGVGH
jgi:foldase protein PrsA